MKVARDRANSSPDYAAQKRIIITKKLDHYTSGKLPTYPSPKPVFCPKWEVIINIGQGEG